MSKSHSMSVIHSSVEPNWRTDPQCYQALDLEYGFQLDAAANAEDHLSTAWLGPGSPLGENALLRQWNTHGIGTRVFINPPFSRSLAAAYTTGRIRDKESGAWVAHPIDREKAESYTIENWVEKCWWESKDHGCWIVGLIPFAPQTSWYRKYVYGHNTDYCPEDPREWLGHAAMQERRLPHRIQFVRPDGTAPEGGAGVNTAIVVWGPATGMVGPWQPHSFYWSYR